MLHRFDIQYEVLPGCVQEALGDMSFNLGLPRLAGFKRMLAAIRRSDWNDAARELMDSRYANQVSNRARRNRDLILDASAT